MRETWYLLEDGSAVDPGEVGHDDSGVLRHSSGAAVAMRGQTPSSRSFDVDVDAEGKKSVRPSESRQSRRREKSMKPAEQGGGYVTRESKSE